MTHLILIDQMVESKKLFAEIIILSFLTEALTLWLMMPETLHQENKGQIKTKMKNQQLN